MLKGSAKRWDTSAKRDILYGRRWREARLRFLGQHPLCVMCEAIGRVTAATVVDHIIDHKGDAAIFWDAENWQPLCEQHHNSDKKIIGHGKRPKPAIGKDGWPI